jgi:hypothetical protein
MIVVHGGVNVSTNPQTEKRETPVGEDVARLLERAEKGDATVLPQLRRLLDESPALWQTYGNLALQARGSWVQLAAGPNLLLAECLMRRATALQTDVAGASPSPLDQLLAERVVSCWLRVSYYDGLIAQTRECTPAQARRLQKQHDDAQRHYLEAIKQLATVRKLLTPARSPVEIASKLAGERSGLRLREAPVAAGVPVAN